MNIYIYALCVLVFGNTIIYAESSQKGFEFYKERAEKRWKPGYSDDLFLAGSTAVGIYGLAEGYSRRHVDLPREFPYIAVASAASLGTYLAWELYQLSRMSSPAWLEQMRMFDKKDFAGPVMFGQKNYQVSSEFQIISNIHGPDGYELYFMPQDGDIYDVYKNIIGTFERNQWKKYINFVAIRLTPGVTYSNGKPLPRIIVQLKENLQIDDANTILGLLYTFTSNFPGIGKHPRYSKALTPAKNNLIYTAYGSGEYKELFKPKNFIRKTGWLWNAPDDMAYKYEGQELSLYGQQEIARD